MQFQWEIITTAKRLREVTSKWVSPIACDTETAKNAHLLGVSFSNSVESIYIPLTIFSSGEFVSIATPELKRELKSVFENFDLVGHNFTYDKRFLDGYFDVNTDWCFDTRIGWHLASAPSGPRPYGLKDAMQEVLLWPQTNEQELKNEVEEKGGKLKNGDHYLASLDTLARYACLDTLATIRVYQKLNPWFVENSYHWMMKQMMAYNILLDVNTQHGVAVDRPGLQLAHDRLVKKAEAAKKRFRKLIGTEVGALEEAWADRKIADYKREYNKIYYQSHPEKWKRFNFNSDSDKRELFFDVLRLPVTERTESGAASTSADSLTASIRESVRANRLEVRVAEALGAYLTYEESNTILTNFSSTYLDSSVADNRLHPGFNICGTVSYRLSGFKPYLLNAPFSERRVLKNLKCDEGYIGVHTDLSAIEPTMTAHFSDDPFLHKVFGKGLGDIYLDLALELFPKDIALREGYNPHIPITKEVKQRFEKQRNIAKVIQLAVQYTGTKHTVARNLSKKGFYTTLAQADDYVQAYWNKFSKVKEMNDKLFVLNRRQGHLRNVIGRIIQVPHPDYKDLPNRFIQSSAHDALILWVLEIYRLCAQRNIAIKPILLDCHDSTSNQVPRSQVGACKEAYAEALASVNTMLGLSVTIKAETKTFETLAGLKGEE